MDLREFVDRLDRRLDTGAYADVDPSANGLQVGPASGSVDHAAFAVDGVEATFEEAADVGADCLVVHHGISWGGFDRVTGGTYERVATLVETDVALYASHLPLDGHPELGNGANLADHLDLEITEPFGEMGPEHVGQRARFPDGRSVASVRDSLSELEHRDGRVRVLEFGPDRIEDVGIVTGAGTDWIGEARRKDLDALVTGEAKQQAYHEAREAGIHVFLAGHYATETFGVRALRELVDEWGPDTTYVSHPTGI